MPTSSLGFSAVSIGGMSFTNIDVSEVDVGIASPFTGSGPALFGVSLGSYDGLDWAAFDSGIYGAGSSETLTFTFTVSAVSGNLITALNALYAVDVFQGTGDHMSAIETAYDMNGNLLGTQTFTYGQTNSAPVALVTGQQNINVTINIVESIDATGTALSLVDMSGIEATFAQSVAPPPPTASIGDIVFLDMTGSGLEPGFDAGPGIPGVTVELLDATGTLVLETTTTDANGAYSFGNLQAGTYEIGFIAPTGYSFTAQGVGTDSSINSSADIITGITGPITLTAGQADHNVEAGLVPPGSAVMGTAAIGDFVWWDANANGVQDLSESGIAGVTVNLLDSTGSVVLANTTTDSTGHYAFANLNAGSYEVQFVTPTGDVITASQQGGDSTGDSDPDAGTGVTGPISLAADQTNATIDAGIKGTSSIGDYVWGDANGNGIQDAGESGIAGVTVELLNGDGSAIIETTTTDGAGHYAFSNLLAGPYEVAFVAPAGEVFTTAQQGGNAAVDSNANVATGISAPVTLTAGQSDNTIDAGLCGTGAIGDDVWWDANANGVQDGAETGIAGVAVKLLNGTGTAVLATTTTDGTGHYAFNGLLTGSYEVQFVAPTGDVFTAAAQGSDTSADSNPNAASGITAAIALANGQVDNTIDAGLKGTSGIGDYVWLDTNGNGIQDSTETGVAGVTVHLLNSTGTAVLALTTTDSAGHYAFTNLVAGTYEVQFVAPTNETFTTALQGTSRALDSNANTTTGLTAPVTLTAGQIDTTIDAGLKSLATAALGEFVWWDANGNGLQDSGEIGITGVTVDLLNSTGTTVLAATTTDSTGHYAFTNLAAGSYEVKFIAPTGDTFTAASQGTNAAIDSNPNAATGITAPVTLATGQTDNSIDAGLKGSASLGDYVWWDINANGIQDGAETGIAGVTVDLLNSAGTAVLAVTTTDGTGHYGFANLIAGSYEVKFIAPTGNTFTAAAQGSNTALDSNPNATTGITSAIALTAGQANITIDAGLCGSAALGDYVWWDINANGIQDGTETGIAGVTVDLLNSTGTAILAATTTDSAGHYAFANLIAGSYEVKFIAPTGDVFTTALQGTNNAADSNANAVTGITAAVTLTTGQTDSTIDAGLKGSASLGDYVWWDTNANGIQDSTETGVAGVTVDLLNGPGTAILAATTTDSTGHYAFTNLLAGSYEVKFIAPAGDVFTGAIQGTNTALDSNANATTGISAPVTLASGQTDNSIDAGLHATAALGDYVWWDINANGIQDASETGIAGITVDLLNSTGTAILAATTTDSTGHYAFTNLAAGSYAVKFIAPAGDVFTGATQGTNTTVDSNANATTGITAAVTLTAGQNNTTIDAGLKGTASLGNFVWLDTNANGLQDTAEKGVAGVTVDLLNSTGTMVLAVITTDANGNYAFNNLLAGSYEVKFVAPSGDTFSLQNQGTVGALNSDPSPTTGITAAVTLTAGQANTTIDAGLVNRSGLSVLKLPCKVVVNSCGQISYSFNVTNTGTSALTNVAIKDNIGTAMRPDYVTPIAVTSGAYNIGDVNHNGALDAGEIWKYTETVNQIACNTGSSGSVCHTAAGSHLGAGCTAWLNSSFDPTSCKDGATYVFQGITCTISGKGVGSNPIVEKCPDAVITFSNSCAQASTSFDSGRNCWVTTLPSNCNAGSVFLSGRPLTVPTGCDLTNCTVTWSIDDSSNNCGSSSISWDGSCTGFSSFNKNGCNGATDYNPIGVKVCDNTSGYGSGGSCNQGYGWNGSSYCDSGYGYGSQGYGSGNGYGSWDNGGYNSYGWTGSANDDAGTPENQYTQNNCDSGSYTQSCSGYGSSGGSCGDSGSCTTSGGTMAPLTTAQFATLNSGTATYGPSAAATFADGPYTVTSGTASQLFTGPKASLANSILLVISASSASIAALGTQTIQLSFNGQLITFSAANFASSSADGFPSNISGLANGLVNNISFSSSQHAGVDFTFSAPLSSAGATGAALGIVVVTSPIDLRVDVFGDKNGVIIDNAANSGAEGVKGVAGATGSPGIMGAADTVAVTATTTTGATLTASDTKEVQVLSSNSNVSVDCTAPTGSLFQLFGAGHTLEFTYNPGNTVSTKTVAAGLASVTGTNSNALAFMEISNNANPLATGAKIYFEGAVTTGEKIYADATTDIFANTPIAAPSNHFDTTAGADIYAYVWKSQADFVAGAAPTQTMAYNASGSQAMYANDMIGSLKLVGYVGASGGYLAS